MRNYQAEWKDFPYTFPQTFVGVKSERVFWKGRCAKNLFILQTGRAVGSFFKLQSQHMCPETTIYFASRISGAQVCYSEYAKHFDQLDSITILQPVAELMKLFCILIHQGYSQRFSETQVWGVVNGSMGGQYMMSDQIVSSFVMLVAVRMDACQTLALWLPHNPVTE